MSMLQPTRWNETEDELLLLLVDSVKDYAIFAMDATGQVRSWNPGAERLLGYSELEIVGQSAALFFTAEDIQSGVPQQELIDVVAAGRTADERWQVRKDGRRFWSIGTTTALWDENRQLRGFAKIMRDQTCRKHVDDTLKDSLAYAQGVVEAVRESLLILGSDLRVKSANRSFYETFRVSEGETQGQLIYHLGDHQWDIPQLRILLEEILPEKSSFDGFEVEHEFRAIGRKIMLLNARRLFQEGSRTELILLAIEDITDRRRIEEAGRALETRFASLVKNIKDHAIMTFDLEARFTSWNVEAEQTLGYTEAEMMGQPFASIFTPEDIRAGQPEWEIQTATETGRGVDERWHVCKDGEWIWSYGIVTPTHDVDGKHTGFSKILRNMTEQKLTELEFRRERLQAEKQIRERTSELRRINKELQQEVDQRQQSESTLRLRDRAIQAVSQGILITDCNLPDNPIIYVSRGFERITGYPADEVLGRNCRFLQGQETDSESVNAIREAIRAGRECSIEILNYRKDGTKFWNALTVSPVLDDDQKLACYVGVLADVTERRALEQAFQQSQKMQVVGHLASGIAHDFNNLLTVILGYSEYMLTTMVTSDPMRDSVEAISEAGERAALLTQQLLAFSRQSILQPKILELNSVVHDTEKMLRRLIGENIALTSILDPHIWRVKVDPGQLNQVLMNLAANARDAMPKGGKLTLETRNVELDEHFALTHAEVRAGKYVMLAVSDSGFGMSHEIKTRIFEPFFTTKSVDKGTGLGLSVVHGIVKQSGGHIEVYSELNMGTTFKLYFPACLENTSTAKEGVVGTRRLYGSETILLVEDEDAVRGLALLVLQNHGYNVLTAADGQSALLVVDEYQGEIDLLFTDLIMPRMGGAELANILGKRFPKIKVLFSSGYTDDLVVRHGLLEAEVAFLQKPYSTQLLATKVREVLEKA